MYKTLRYRLQFWTDFHEIHSWCGSTHGWTLLFLETTNPIEPQIWRKMCPQNQNVVLWEKNLKIVFGTLFFKKWLCSFLSSRFPVSSKWSCFPKIIFRRYFGKYYFSKKLFNEKYSKRRCLQKRLYWFLLLDVFLPPKRSCFPTNGFFSVFSKNTVFFVKLVL